MSLLRRTLRKLSYGACRGAIGGTHTNACRRTRRSLHVQIDADGDEDCDYVEKSVDLWHVL